MISHATLPLRCISKRTSIESTLAAAMRRSAPCLVFEIRLREPFRILRVSIQTSAFAGPLGTHDEHGVFPSSIVQHEGRQYLYTSCWERGERPSMNYNSIDWPSATAGNPFGAYSVAAIMASDFDPCFVAMPTVLREGRRNGGCGIRRATNGRTRTGSSSHNMTSNTPSRRMGSTEADGAHCDPGMIRTSRGHGS